MAAQFRSYVWDPALIVAQMVLLQAGYYSSLGLWLALLGTLGSTGPSLQQVFSDEVRARPGKRPWAQAPGAGGELLGLSCERQTPLPCGHSRCEGQPAALPVWPQSSPTPCSSPPVHRPAVLGRCPSMEVKSSL